MRSNAQQPQECLKNNVLSAVALLTANIYIGWFTYSTEQTIVSGS